MRKTTLITLLLFVCLISTFAQERKNSIFLEGGGAGLWYSVNYEYRIPVRLNQRLALGGGISMIPVWAPHYIGIASASYLVGHKNIFEFGISPAYMFTDEEFWVSARIGYRYEASGGFQFRIGFSPIYGKFAETGLPEYNGKGFLPWGYLSVGYTF